MLVHNAPAVVDSTLAAGIAGAIVFHRFPIADATAALTHP